MLARTDRRLRLVSIIAIFSLVACALVGRLAYWQIGQRDRLVGMARNQLQRAIVEPSQRGSIYDRSGTVVLAATTYHDLLWGTPAVIPVDHDHGPDRPPGEPPRRPERVPALVVAIQEADVERWAWLFETCRRGPQESIERMRTG